MNVFFTASFKGKDKYQREYDLILKILEEQDVEVFSPEKGNYLDLLTTSQKTMELADQHYLAVKKGIAQADAVVLEVSEQDFQLGHEATLAIQSKTPVLCLSKSNDFSKEIRHRYFYGAKYSKYSVRYEIEQFIKQSRKARLSERFNFFLSSTQLAKLEKFSDEQQINSSQIIRDLIDNL